jgi:glycosyltransferase involved in cell wall biosynthesis
MTASTVTRGVSRICISIDGFDPMGGTERQITQLSLELRERGFDIFVLARWPVDVSNPYHTALADGGITVVTSGYRGPGVGRSRRLTYVRRRVSVTGLRSHEQTEASLWRWQSRVLRKRLIPGFVLHEIPFFGVIAEAGRDVIGDLHVPTVHTVFGEMPGVVPVAAAPWAIVTTDGVAKISGSSSPDWIPSMGSEPTALGRIGRRDPRFHVVYAGRLVPQKGIDVLIAAVALMGASCRVTVAGYGPELGKLQALAGERNVSAEFVGIVAQEKIATLLATADVVVHPALHGEGVPSTVAEALAVGTPVVASNVGGIGRLARLGGINRPIRVVPPGDASAVADAMRNVASRSEELRKSARELYERRLCRKVVVDEYLECYARALGRV